MPLAKYLQQGICQHDMEATNSLLVKDFFKDWTQLKSGLEAHHGAPDRTTDQCLPQDSAVCTTSTNRN